MSGCRLKWSNPTALRISLPSSARSRQESGPAFEPQEAAAIGAASPETAAAVFQAEHWASTVVWACPATSAASAGRAFAWSARGACRPRRSFRSRSPGSQVTCGKIFVSQILQEPCRLFGIMLQQTCHAVAAGSGVKRVVLYLNDLAAMTRNFDRKGQQSFLSAYRNRCNEELKPVPAGSETREQ